MQMLHASHALLPEGWRRDLRVGIEEGRIASVGSGRAEPGDTSVDCLLPAPSNLHSHMFQRAMAGLTERASAGLDKRCWH